MTRPDTAPTPPSPAALVQRVQQLGSRVHGAATAAGHTDLADRLVAQARRWGETTCTVVVAGAQKRGKSSLLNVLVGAPGLLVVDADIATHTHVTLRHGEQVQVTVLRTAPQPALQVDPAQLADYSSVLGDPARRSGVTGVEVTVPAPLLHRVTLVDTPGVDSLTVSHRHATVAALARADVLLFAVGAQDQPVLRHELEFLAEAAALVPVIVFVLTKVDDTASWPDLLTQNQARLRDFLDTAVRSGELDAAVRARLRDAPWFPVSARLGAAALRLAAEGRAERAANRRARSGLGELEEHLHGCADRVQLLRAHAALLLVDSVLRVLGEEADDRAIVDDDGAIARRRAELETEQAALERLRARRRQHAIGHQFLGQEAADAVRARMAALRAAYDHEIGALRSPAEATRYVDALPEVLQRSVAAAWEQIAAGVVSQAQGTLAGYLATFGVSGLELDATVLRREFDTPAVAAPGGAPRARSKGETLTVGLSAASLGFLAQSVVFQTLTAVIGAFTVPAVLPAAVGVTVAGAILADRRRRERMVSDRQELTAAVREVFGAVEAQMRVAVQQAVSTWKLAAEGAADEALTTRTAALRERREELAKTAERDVAERRRAAKEAETQLRLLDELARAEQRLRREVAAALAGPGLSR